MGIGYSNLIQPQGSGSLKFIVAWKKNGKGDSHTDTVDLQFPVDSNNLEDSPKSCTLSLPNSKEARRVN